MGLKIDLFRNETDGVSFAAGQVIFTEGEVGTSMYVVLEGQVELKIRGKFVETLEPGELFGEMALIDHNYRSAKITAETELRCLVFVAWIFRPFALEHPESAWALLEMMVRRVREAENR